MASRAFCFTALAGIVLLLGAETASAQSPRGPYFSPSGPTVTPYLDYFRQDNGVLNPYYNFVRPRARVNAELRQLESQLQQQNSRQSDLKRDLQQMRNPTAAVTGTGATFQNLSHFYPQSGTAGQRPGQGVIPGFRR